MKLYITDTSPYARIARVVILEKGLENRISIIYALTRLADSLITVSIPRVVCPISYAMTVSD